MSAKKVCPNCQTENDAVARFCFHCGNELPEESEMGKICNKCGFTNSDDARYCASCGNPLEGKVKVGGENPPSRMKSGQRKTGSKSSSARYAQRLPAKMKWNSAPVILGVGVVLFVLYFLFMNQNSNAPANSYTEQRTMDVVFENRVMEIASKFVCACGGCPEEPLESCSCPSARRERDFIRSSLNQGMSDEEIILAVNRQVGGLRPDYAEKYEVETQLSIPEKFNPAIPDIGENNSPGTELATFANRQEIISRFACPCGQCGMDELKDCTCDHPNGAKDVKKFIDDKISQGTFTVAEVVELVEKQYGGRIR